MPKLAERPNMRFVPIKSVEQQDIQNFHRQRERIKKERTALVNQVRGLLAEQGVVINKGVAAVRKKLPEILEDAENGLTALARELFAELLEELRVLDQRFEQCGQRIAMQGNSRHRVHITDSTAVRIRYVAGGCITWQPHHLR